MMNVSRLAWIAVVCMGVFAMPSLANPSVVGKWEGSCVQKFDGNYNCVKKGHVAAQAFYMDISKSGSDYKFSTRADPAIVSGGVKLYGYKDTFVLPISGNPAKGPAHVIDLDEIHDSFTMYLQRIGSNDILTISSIWDAVEGPLPTPDLFPPLFCDPNVVYGPGPGKKANTICTLFRKK